MQTNYPSKETKYRGYNMRSRLEARWATFFDDLKLSWVYEPETFRLSNGKLYLPDFWLPDFGVWAEVKPTTFTKDETDKCGLLARDTERPCIMLDGVPEATNYWVCFPEEQPSDEIYDIDDMVFIYTSSLGRMWMSSGWASYPKHTDYLTKNNYENCPPDLLSAVRAARSARFEFGQCGATL